MTESDSIDSQLASLDMDMDISDWCHHDQWPLHAARPGLDYRSSDISQIMCGSLIRACVKARLPDHLDQQNTSQKKEWEITYGNYVLNALLVLEDSVSCL